MNFSENGFTSPFCGFFISFSFRVEHSFFIRVVSSLEEHTFSSNLSAKKYKILSEKIHEKGVDSISTRTVCYRHSRPFESGIGCLVIGAHVFPCCFFPSTPLLL